MRLLRFTNSASGIFSRRYASKSYRAYKSSSSHVHHRALYPTVPLARRSAADPLTVLLALGASIGLGYLANTLDTAAPLATKREEESNEQPLVETTPEDDSIPGMPTTTPPGRPGNLTPEQEVKLKEFWIACLDVFGVAHEHSNAVNGSNSSTTTSSTATGGDEKKKKSKLGIFGKHHKESAGSDSAADEDKHGQTKEFKLALASMSPETLRGAFWSMVKHDNPDALLLRFLRARKWDVHNALVMLVSTMHWRAEEMHVDDDIMFNGDGGALQLSKTGSGDAKKDAADFIGLLGLGMSFLHGTDAEGRPICAVRARLHKPGERTEKSLEKYTVYIIETARLLLKPPVDTATIVFDLTGFSMSNMDYTPVKFMIKCFEANYPESLGSVLVYKAPWIFQGIWKIIKGWLDPVVASKVHFASDEKELAEWIPKSRIMKELGGEDDYKYTYIEPVEGENKLMEDKETRAKIEGERKGMVESFEKATLVWAKGESSAGDRESIANQLRDNYWVLDPYVRARSIYDRLGLIGAGGKLDFYPSSEKQQVSQAPLGNTHANDVD